MKRNTCLVCGNKLFDEPILVLNGLPDSAQGMPTFEQLDTDKGFNLELCQCSGCGLIQLNGEPVTYYHDVIRSCNYNETVRKYRLEQYAELIDTFSLGGKKIIEVGCGQGEFLGLFEHFDVTAVGLEHKKELVDMARANGLTVYQGFAENEETVIEGVPYDAFVSFNFLEHLPDPNGYLRCIYNNLSEKGCGLISVPSFEYIAEGGRWYELIRDHLSYYTAETICFCMEHNGFRVMECHRSNEDSLLVTVQKKPKININSVISGINSLRVQLNDYIDSYVSHGGKVAVWGASHQCFTLLSTMGIENKIEYIIDSAPFKQGRYSPASHVPIVAPQQLTLQPVDAIIIIAPAYAREIEKIIKIDFDEKIAISAILSNNLEIRT